MNLFNKNNTIFNLKEKKNYGNYTEIWLLGR